MGLPGFATTYWQASNRENTNQGSKTPNDFDDCHLRTRVSTDDYDMTQTTLPEPNLATGWPISRVVACLQSANKNDLIAFLERRYEERFFKPIHILKTNAGNHRGFGFAIMALCSLLIESLQSYRYGLPTTYEAEYSQRLAKFAPPPEYVINKNEHRNGRQAFEDFFSLSVHKPLFPGVDGVKFYAAIRNGLLHQAQTKEGWRIRSAEPRLWNTTDKIVDRTKFANALKKAFEKYIEELTAAPWTDDVWCERPKRSIFPSLLSDASPQPLASFYLRDH